MNLPTLRLTLNLPDPNYVPVFADHSPRAINADEYSKDFEVEVEVVQLNLNSGGMRVRFPWPNKHRKNGMEIQSRDVSIEHFFKKYRVVETQRFLEMSWQGVDRQGGI